MRIDKFLKVSRLVKRRQVAKEMADKGRVEINHKLVKSSTTVQIGDVIQLTFGHKLVTVRVDAILESTKKDDAQKMYTILSEEMMSK